MDLEGYKGVYREYGIKERLELPKIENQMKNMDNEM